MKTKAINPLCLNIVVIVVLVFMGYFVNNNETTVVSDPELVNIKGAGYKSDHILFGTQCGTDSAPSGDNGCVKKWMNAIPPIPGYYCCEGGCNDWCVNTDLKKYCKCSNGNSCNEDLVHACTGGTLYTKTNNCTYTGGDCSNYNYAQISGDCGV